MSDEQYGRKSGQLSLGGAEVTNSCTSQENEDEARRFLFQMQGQRYPNDGVTNAPSAFYTIKFLRRNRAKCRSKILARSVVCSTPLHWRPMALAS